jgi:hypothetical protein
MLFSLLLLINNLVLEAYVPCFGLKYQNNMLMMGMETLNPPIPHLKTVAASLIGLTLPFSSIIDTVKADAILRTDMPTVIDLDTNEPKITDTAWLDVQIGDSAAQRIEIGLYGDITPLTVNNFKQLCKAETNGYIGSSFFRIISDFSVQGGNIGNTPDAYSGSKLGQYGRAFTGESFPPENFIIRHDYKDAGILSMMKDLKNKGK